jgi:hypothetical protein
LSSDGKRQKAEALRAFQEDVRYSIQQDLVQEIEDPLDFTEFEVLSASSPPVLGSFASPEERAAQDVAFAEAYAAAMLQIDYDIEACSKIASNVPLSHNHPWPSITPQRTLHSERRRSHNIISRRPSEVRQRSPSASNTPHGGSPAGGHSPYSARNSKAGSSAVLSFRQKYQAQLQAVLKHSKAVEALRSFMETEHSEENLDFLVALNAFRKKFPTESKEVTSGKLIAHATKLYEQFVSATGPSAVNLTSTVAEQLTVLFKNQETHQSGINQWVFNEAQEHVFTLVCQDTFWRFIADAENLQLVEKAVEKAKS